MQTRRWPQGRKTTPTSALKHTLHCILVLFSISTSLEKLLHPEQSPSGSGWYGGEGRDGARENLSVIMLIFSSFSFLSFSFFLSSLKIQSGTKCKLEVLTRFLRHLCMNSSPFTSLTKPQPWNQPACSTQGSSSSCHSLSPPSQ